MTLRVTSTDPRLTRTAKSYWRIRTAHAAFMAEAPTTCPRCGSRSLMTVFATDRRSWLCLTCRRETSPGGEG